MKLDESQATLLPLQIGLDKRNELENRISKSILKSLIKNKNLMDLKKLLTRKTD